MNLLSDMTGVFSDFSQRRRDIDSPITDIEHDKRKRITISNKKIKSPDYSYWKDVIVPSAYLYDIYHYLSLTIKNPEYSGIKEWIGLFFMRSIQGKTIHGDLHSENILLSEDKTCWSDLLSFVKPISFRRISDSDTDYTMAIERPDIYSDIVDIFNETDPAEFEDGMQNAFVDRLLDKVREYGDFAVVEISHIILNEKTNPECAAEALKWLGNMDHNDTYKYRQWLLTTALSRCKSPVVRDGANLGLAFMDDPATIPYFEKAISNEKFPLLKKLMKKTLKQLENTHKCLST